MRKLLLWGVLMVMLSVNGYCGIVEDVKKLRNAGEFTKATELIDKYLVDNQTVDEQVKQKLLFEKERFSRIRWDFSETETTQIETMKKNIKGFKSEEFYEWDKKGYLDKKVIDGKTYYLDSNTYNLFFAHEEIYNRAIGWKDLNKVAQSRLKMARDVITGYEKEKTQLVNKTTVTLELTLTIEKNVVPAGKIVKYWMPFPLEINRQKDIELVETSTEPKKVVSNGSDIGYVYLEQKAVKDKPTVFTAKIKMTTFAFYQPIDAAKVQQYDPNDETYKKYIQFRTEHETPLPEFKELVKKIIGDETNPYLKAKKIYDWIPTYIRYSYSPEYSTIDNLTKFFYDRRRGDCGVQTLLFMTFCKIAGVPTRWQSGWTTDGEFAGMHDWCEIYIMPYGWLPVDMSFGSHAIFDAYGMPEADKKLLNEFFFGNIDQYRWVVNNQHTVDLDPPKKSFRSDIGDFQRGELEYDDTNIYFDKFKCRVKVIK